MNAEEDFSELANNINKSVSKVTKNLKDIAEHLYDLQDKFVDHFAESILGEHVTVIIENENYKVIKYGDSTGDIFAYKKVDERWQSVNIDTLPERYRDEVSKEAL